MKYQQEQRKETLIQKLVQDIVKQQQFKDPENIAQALDYEADKILEWIPVKQEFCRQLLSELERVRPEYPRPEIQKAIRLFQDAILGKLFYYALQENHKYLVIDKLSPKEDKNKLLKEIEIIESSPDRAMFYLDALERGDHRHFMRGIVGCLYG
jgi:hypothetical protein